MKKIIPILLICSLLLVGCGAKTPAPDIMATTLPVYEFTQALCQGTELTVGRLIAEPISCLHDYSLNVNQVKQAEGADTLVISGGELQRVLLALALEPMPNILILDEPLSGVDVEGMTTLMDMLDEIRKTYDLSILMTTHDFSMLPRYADQAVLIDGTVRAMGKPEEVLSSQAFRDIFHMKGGAL